MKLNSIILQAAAQLLLLAIQGVLYIGIQYFQKDYHDMQRAIDRRIPVLPQAIFAYVLWYPLIAVYPLYLYTLSKEDYHIYMAAIIADIIISIIIYYIYPSSFERPEAPKKGLSGKIFRLIRFGNYRGLNCMPSMHCSMCFIVMLSAVSCCIIAVSMKLLLCILCCMIIFSTIFTKQHVILDLAAAIPLAAVCFLIGRGLYFAVI